MSTIGYTLPGSFNYDDDALHDISDALHDVTPEDQHPAPRPVPRPRIASPTPRLSYPSLDISNPRLSHFSHLSHLSQFTDPDPTSASDDGFQSALEVQSDEDQVVYSTPYVPRPAHDSSLSQSTVRLSPAASPTPTANQYPFVSPTNDAFQTPPSSPAPTISQKSTPKPPPTPTHVRSPSRGSGAVAFNIGVHPNASMNLPTAPTAPTPTPRGSFSPPARTSFSPPARISNNSPSLPHGPPTHSSSPPFTPFHSPGPSYSGTSTPSLGSTGGIMSGSGLPSSASLAGLVVNAGGAGDGGVGGAGFSGAGVGVGMGVVGSGNGSGARGGGDYFQTHSAMPMGVGMHLAAPYTGTAPIPTTYPSSAFAHARTHGYAAHAYYAHGLPADEDDPAKQPPPVPLKSTMLMGKVEKPWMEPVPRRWWSCGRRGKEMRVKRERRAAMSWWITVVSGCFLSFFLPCVYLSLSPLSLLLFYHHDLVPFFNLLLRFEFLAQLSSHHISVIMPKRLLLMRPSHPSFLSHLAQ